MKKSAYIKHKEHGYRVCNICQDAEIDEDNVSGVCNMCLDNKIKDSEWPEEYRNATHFTTDEDGNPSSYMKVRLPQESLWAIQITENTACLHNSPFNEGYSLFDVVEFDSERVITKLIKNNAGFITIRILKYA